MNLPQRTHVLPEFLSPPRPALTAVAALLLTAALATRAPGAISVGDSGSGVMAFGTQPAATEWSTATSSGIGGTAGSITDAASCDAVAQTLAAGSIATQLLSGSSMAPPTANEQARWNSGLLALPTRPLDSGGSRATVRMATLLNTSSGGITKLNISYDYSMYSVTNSAEQLPGLRAYYSMTGLPNSWTAIPALCGDATAGTPGPATSLSTEVTLSSTWSNNTKLYVLWLDPNATLIDNAYWIDNANFVPTQVVPEAKLLSFNWGAYAGSINGTNVSLTVPYGTDLTTLNPTYTASPGASDPTYPSGTARDFSTSSQTYTIQASGGNPSTAYTVTVYHAAAPGTIDTVPPGLSAGSQYRLVFVTDGRISGKLFTGIGTYNTFAATEAARASGLSALGTTWSAMISYRANGEAITTAPANTLTRTSDPSVPIYNLAGMLVASGNTPLWGGSIVNPINRTQLGGTPDMSNLNSLRVNTGTFEGGTSDNESALGYGDSGTFVRYADASKTTAQWTNVGRNDGNQTNLIYVLSGILTVPDLTLCNITSFSITDSISATIDNDAKTVSVVLPYGTSLVSLTPTIVVSPYATVSPNSGVAQDFSLGAVNYTVTGGDMQTTKTYAVTVAEAPSPYCVMTGFAINDVAGTIDQDAQTVAVTLPYGTSLNSLTPTIEFSLGASVDPGSGVAHNFSSPPVDYKVTSQDGNHSKTYGVTVNVTPGSTACDILTFAAGSYPVTITGTNIKVLVPYGTDVSALAPTYTMSQYAMGAPPSTTARNFTTPQTYTITAQNGSTQQVYTATVVQGPAPGTVSPIPPGLPAGTQYRLVFVTSGMRNAGSTAIADYNDFVAASAAAVPSLNALGTTWKVIGSTSAVKANVNTLTRSTDPSAPIYRLDSLLVANGNTDLWDGTIANPIGITETGANATAAAWTGTNASGTVGGDWMLGDQAHMPGGGWCYWGDQTSIGTGWVASLGAPHSNQTANLSLYAMSGILTVPVYSAPGAPTLGTVTPGGGQLTVAYTAGADNGAPITNYEYSLNSGAWASAASTANPLVITGLGYGVSYTVAIRAINAAGPSPASATSDAVTTLLGVPTAPTITGITPGGGTLSVAFTAPSADGGAAITNYKYSSDGGSTYTAVSPEATTSPILISGLANGTTYQVKILAVNSTGDGTPSAAMAGTPFSTPNDNFVDAIALPGASGTRSGTSNIGATFETGEPTAGPDPSYANVTHTVWFKWTAPSNGSFTIFTNGSKAANGVDEFDAVMGIFTGAAVNALTTVAIAPDMGVAETLTIDVTSGITYYIQIAGYDNQQALNIKLTWSLLASGNIYDNWATTNGASGGAAADSNHNGVPNGVEYFMGGTQASPATLPAMVDNAGTWTWTIPYDPTALASYYFEVSANLGSWTPLSPGPGSGIEVLTVPDRIRLTLPTGMHFARLVVTPN